MFYYILHPNHIENYVDFVGPEEPDRTIDPTDVFFLNQDDKPKKDDDNDDTIGRKKTIIYHEIDGKKKYTGFPSELLIQHSYATAN